MKNKYRNSRRRRHYKGRRRIKISRSKTIVFKKPKYYFDPQKRVFKPEVEQ